MWQPLHCNNNFVALTKHLPIWLQAGEQNSGVDMLHSPQVWREDPVGVVYYVYVLEDTELLYWTIHKVLREDPVGVLCVRAWRYFKNAHSLHSSATDMT